MKRVVSIFILLLMILLPINFSLSVSAVTEKSYGPGYTGNGGISGTNAASLGVKSFYGSNEFEGFRKRSDMLNIVVQAKLGDNITVSPENLELHFEQWAEGYFTSCNLILPEQSVYECTYQEKNASIAPVSDGIIDYEIKLVENSTIMKTVTEPVVVDNLAPFVSKFEIEESKTNKENISIDFTVKDLAFGAHPGIGIKSLVITSLGSEVYRYPSNTTNNTINIRKVTLTDEAKIPLPAKSGLYDICIEAFDYFEHRSLHCQNIEVDVDSPKIAASSLKVLNPSNEEYEWVTDNSFPLKISVDYLGSDINFDSIYANFSDINVNPINNVKGNCDKLDQAKYRCEFNVNAKINSSASRSLVFYGEDDIGNPVVSRLTTSFRYDDVGPLAKTLLTPYYYNGVYFVGKDPINASVEFEEKGVGMNNSLAFAGFQNIGYDSNVQADSCVEGWRCTWNNVQANVDGSHFWEISNESYEVQGKKSEIIVLPQTSDDLDNFADMKKFDLVADVYEPMLDNSRVIQVPGNNNDFGENYTIAGDSIFIEYNFSEGSFVDMKIEGKDFISGFKDQIRCNDNGDGTHSCQYVLGPITKEGPYDGKIKLEFTDIVNNKLEEEVEVKVFGVENETTDYWNGRVGTCRPNPLDRELVEKISTDAYCPIELQANSDVQIFDLSEGACSLIDVSSSGNENISPSLKNYNWMGIGSNSKNLYLNLVIGAFNPRINGMTYQCQVNVRSLVNDEVLTKQYEPVNVTLDFTLFNNPVGEMSEEVWDEATGIYEKYIGGGWDIVGYLASIFDLSNKICGIADKIIGIIDGIQKIGTIMHWSEKGLKSQPFTGQAGKGVGTISGGMYSSAGLAENKLKTWWKHTLGKYCAFASCKLAYKEGWMASYQEAMMTALDYITLNKLIRDHTGGFGNFATSIGMINGDMNKVSTSGDKKGSGSGVTPEEELKGYYHTALNGDDYPNINTGALKTFQREPTEENFQNIATRDPSQLKGNEYNLLRTAATLVKPDSKAAQSTQTIGSVVKSIVTGDVVANSITGNAAYSSKDILGAPSPNKYKINMKEKAAAAAEELVANADPAATKTDPSDITPKSNRLSGDWSITGEYQELSNLPASPYDNYIMSIATLCLPGMIHNLEKFRQIQCEYGLCLLRSSEGTPLDVCQANKGYSECKFIYGPIFQLIPGSMFLSKIQKAIAQLMTKPELIVDVAFDFVCNTKIAAKWICGGTDSPCVIESNAVILCYAYDTFGFFSEIYTDFLSIQENGIAEYFGMGEGSMELGPETGSCKDFSEKYENLSEKNS